MNVKSLPSRVAGRARQVSAIAAALAVLMAGPAQAEIIDRILAVVDRELITLSDVSAAARLGLVPAPSAGTDPIRGTLDALIARQLELGEANRYQPPEPSPEQLAARLETVRARFRQAADLDQALKEAGLTLDQLRLRIRDDLRIDVYLSQRFGTLRQPSEQEVAEYYRAHPADFSTGAAVRPLDEVRDEARARAAAAQRATFLQDWLEGLRRRTPIADLYVAEK